MKIAGLDTGTGLGFRRYHHFVGLQRGEDQGVSV